MRSLFSLSLAVVFAFVGLFAWTSLVMEGSHYAFEHPAATDWEFYQSMLATSAAPYVALICVVGFLAVVIQEIRKYAQSRSPRT